MVKKSFTLYDTTLRDGNQALQISFSLKDKLQMTEQLDLAGIHYIEGGWPNPTHLTDVNYFQEVKKLNLKHSRIAAFGSTRRAHQKAKDDPIFKALLDVETETVTIFGKSWDLHVTHVLKTTLPENLKMIEDSVAYLKSQGREVIYDAEHFFDGYQHHHDYALKTLRAAVEGGADLIVLCDTNGGTLPDQVEKIYQAVEKQVKTTLGVHFHNDSGLGVANSILCAQLGTQQIQGTFNSYGERCGNANLSTIIPNLKLKLGIDCISDENLKKITPLSVFIAEIANLPHDIRQPFVGESAFSHKGGAHIDGVLKISESFEHIDPQKVGNKRSYVLSDQAGGSMILERIKKLDSHLTKNDQAVKTLLHKVKDMESQGYHFEAADASFELLAMKTLGKFEEFFSIKGYRVIEEKREDGAVYAEAMIKIQSGDRIEHTAAEGLGPLNALDNAVRKALSKFYPALQNVHLADFKVRVVEGRDGTAAKVRVLIQSTDGDKTWGTVGVSSNIIEAAWIALVDSLNYKLLKG